MRRLLALLLVVPTLAGCLGQVGPASGSAAVPDAEATAKLSFEEPVDLVCEGFERPPESCGEFGEPIVEVAGDGTIWASATCCIGETPPIWLSDDGRNFTMLGIERAGPTELVRQTYGIEGSFAIDDAGHVYFFDIALGATWFTSYTADAEHRHTVAHPMPPLVDRPWVRAGAEDEVFLFYNTGRSEIFVPSTDGGRTFDYTQQVEFPCALMVPGQGPTRDRMFVAGCRQDPKLWITTDAGATWEGPEEIPLPDVTTQNRRIGFLMPPASDDDGWIHVPYTHTAGPDEHQKAIFVARRAPDGTWHGPEQVSPPGIAEKPWAVAGRPGHAAVAYYHSPNGTPGDQADARWKLRVSYTTDGQATNATWTTVTPDPDVLLEGDFGRNLGDFLQMDVTPDGRLAIVYGADDGGTVQNRFVWSGGGVDFAPATFLNGPR